MSSRNRYVPECGSAKILSRSSFKTAASLKIWVLLCLHLFSEFLVYLRVIIVPETFSKGVMVYFQLSDLCKK